MVQEHLSISVSFETRRRIEESFVKTWNGIEAYFAVACVAEGGKAAARRHVVQLVSADRLKEHRAQLDDDSMHVQVYSLQPMQPKVIPLLFFS